MRIAIVDDSPGDRDQLLECLNRYFFRYKGNPGNDLLYGRCRFLKGLPLFL